MFIRFLSCVSKTLFCDFRFVKGMRNYYQVLGLPNYAGLPEVKRAYKRMALRYHPDRNPDNPLAEELFKEANEAYQILSSPETKAKYDLLLENGYTYRHSRPHRSSRPAPDEEEPITHRDPRYRGRGRRRTRKAYQHTVQRNPEVKNYISTFVACALVAIIYGLVSSTLDVRSRLHYLTALEAYKKQDWKMAAEEAGLSFTADASYAKAYQLFAQAKYQAGEYDDASEGAATALEYFNRPDYDLRYLYARSLVKVEEFDLAYEQFEEALFIAEQDTTLLAEIAPIYLDEMKNYEQLADLANRWISQDRENPVPHFYKTLAMAHQDSLDSMQSSLETTLAYTDNPKYYLRQLAQRQAVTMKRPRQAAQTLDYLKENYTISAIELVEQADYYRRFSADEAAVKNYTQALSLDSTAHTHYLRALTYLDLNKVDSACFDWSMAKGRGFKKQDQKLRFFCEE